MGLFHWGIPPFLLEWAASQGIRTGVETGTFRGDSAAEIADALGSCVTVELDRSHFDRASRRFAADNRVTVLLGSSADHLRSVCSQLTGPTLFWLDGHYSGAGTAGARYQCPVLAELDAVAALPDPTEHVVLVDDARLFGFVPTVPPGRHDWPGLYTVLSRLESMGLRTYVVDDVVVGIGPRRVEAFEALLHHGGVRQHHALYEHWRALRLWSRWSPRSLARRTRRTVRRGVWRLARRVLPRRVRRRLRHLWRLRR